jgi:uncharacterized protein YjiS (DUF1127 family)
MNTTIRRLPLGARSGLAGWFAEWLARAIAGVRGRIAAARDARAAHAALLGMSDRDLRDIGLTRYELHRLHDDGRL